MRTRMLALGATLLAGAPALIALGSVLLPAPMRWALTITRRLQRVLRIACALPVAAMCPLYATALFVVPLTLNPQQWQEEFGLGVLGMWGMGVVFTYGGWFIVSVLDMEAARQRGELGGRLGGQAPTS